MGVWPTKASGVAVFDAHKNENETSTLSRAIALDQRTRPTGSLMLRGTNGKHPHAPTKPK